MKQFVPMSDAMLFGDVEPPGALLVPYQFGVPCHHALGRADALLRERELASSDEVRTRLPV